MLNENALRHTIATIFGHLKSQKEDLLMLTAEISAMRNTLDELSGGKFLPIFEKHRAKLEARTRGAQDDLLSRFDDTIQKLNHGEVL
jgi:hypothetical protein